MTSGEDRRQRSDDNVRMYPLLSMQRDNTVSTRHNCPCHSKNTTLTLYLNVVLATIWCVMGMWYITTSATSSFTPTYRNISIYSHMFSIKGKLSIQCPRPQQQKYLQQMTKGEYLPYSDIPAVIYDHGNLLLLEALQWPWSWQWQLQLGVLGTRRRKGMAMMPFFLVDVQKSNILRGHINNTLPS